MDLNLLRTFVAVYEARTLTGAGSSLFVTQPAVSQALARLRRAVGDDLFYREGREMVPTPYAMDLYPEVRDSLERIEKAVSTQAFTPATSHRRFRIALSELGEISWLGSIARAVRAAARGVSIDVQALEPARVADLLTRGALDLTINSAPMPRMFDSVLLKVEPYVLLYSDTHELAAHPIDLVTYLSAEHVVMAGDSGRPNIENALNHLGAVPRARLTVNHFSALPLILATTDLVATVPQSFALEWAKLWPLVSSALPFHVDPVAVRLYARSAHSDAPSLIWFRDTVLAAVRAAEESAPLRPLSSARPTPAASTVDATDRRARGTAADAVGA